MYGVTVRVTRTKVDIWVSSGQGGTYTEIGTNRRHDIDRDRSFSGPSSVWLDTETIVRMTGVWPDTWDFTGTLNRSWDEMVVRPQSRRKFP